MSEPPVEPPADDNEAPDFRADPPPSGSPHAAPPPGVSLPAPGEPTTPPPGFQRRDSFGQDAEGWYLPASSTNRPAKRPDGPPPPSPYGPPPTGYGPPGQRPTPGWGPNPPPRKQMSEWQVLLWVLLAVFVGIPLLFFGLCVAVLVGGGGSGFE